VEVRDGPEAQEGRAAVPLDGAVQSVGVEHQPAIGVTTPPMINRGLLGNTSPVRGY
jgi:hypothetical protein